MPHQRKLNVILPHAEKLALQERSGKPLAPQQFWIVAWSESRQVRGRSQIDYILSCTEHHLGTYPLFLVFLHDIPSFSKQAIDSEMNILAQYLSNTVDPRRVFSIFGQEAPVQALSKWWSEYTGHSIVPEPYYEASSSYCTRSTIVNKKEDSLPQGHEMRLAGQSDLPAVSQLCQEFAAESPPFVLTAQRATQEAQYMIDHKLVSVYVIDGQITTIVAVTRRTENVAGMTKVYTTPRFRGRGCAEKLVAHVCQRQLASGVDSVVLFVGHTLAATRVYHRVGFVGVGPGKQHSYTPDAENWLELGFTNTDLGHW